MLNDAQKANLKKYAADGGLILADPAGGNRLFTESFLKLAAELFGPASPANPPFMAQATENGKVWLRHVDNLPRTMRAAELLGCPRMASPGGAVGAGREGSDGESREWTAQSKDFSYQLSTLSALPAKRRRITRCV